MAGDSDSTSPKTINAAVPRPDASADTKTQPEIVAKPEEPATDVAKPLAPPPRPSEATDYFSKNPSLTQEPNPFEKSFSGNGDPILGAGAPETPGGTKLPPVASLTSPSSLLPGGNTPFNWGAGSSLRAGPLSPAMLSAPQTDYFTEQYARSFPTPNESSLRSGLTPGGSGSMFPSNGGLSPGTQAMFNMGVSAGTPGQIDFHRTAMRVAQEQRAQHQSQQSLSVTMPPQEASGTATVKSETKAGPFDNQHDNDAANGLFMLAHGNRNGGQQQSQYPMPPQPHAHPAPPVQHPDTQYNSAVPRANTRGGSDPTSDHSEDSQNIRPNTRGRGKRVPGPTVAVATNGRRKAEDPPVKAPANKKTKLSIGAPSTNGSDQEDDDDGMDENDGGKPKHKMTEEEKRKNFLERNRVAALKCRQRKKQWLANLQNKVDAYQQENDSLHAQVSALREEVVNLKTLLLAHKDCPVTQQQSIGQGSYMPPIEQYPQHTMNAYPMNTMNNYHASMIPAGSSRRPS